MSTVTGRWVDKLARRSLSCSSYFCSSCSSFCSSSCCCIVKALNNQNRMPSAGLGVAQSGFFSVHRLIWRPATNHKFDARCRERESIELELEIGCKAESQKLFQSLASPSLLGFHQALHCKQSSQLEFLEISCLSVVIIFLQISSKFWWLYLLLLRCMWAQLHIFLSYLCAVCTCTYCSSNAFTFLTVVVCRQVAPIFYQRFWPIHRNRFGLFQEFLILMIFKVFLDCYMK